MNNEETFIDSSTVYQRRPILRGASLPLFSAVIHCIIRSKVRGMGLRWACDDNMRLGEELWCGAGGDEV